MRSPLTMVLVYAFIAVALVGCVLLQRYLVNKTDSLFAALSRRRSVNDPVRRVRAALSEIERSRRIPGLEFFKGELLELIRQRDHVVASIDKEHRDPTALIYVMIGNIAIRRLTSGECHIYRGVLNYEGQSLRAAFTAASERLIACGDLNRADYEADLVNLRKEIAQLG